MIRAIEEGVHAGYPKGAGAVLLIELDGPRAEIEAQGRRVEDICRERLALEVRVARDEDERALLWKGRKEAAGAVGRLAPNWLLQDAVVPRSRLPEIMRDDAGHRRAGTGSSSPTSSTPATGTCTRSSATTTGTPTSWPAPSRPTRSCCMPASRSAAA